jgi:hypothetical protein
MRSVECQEPPDYEVYPVLVSLRLLITVVFS